jgi:uncharacterized protein with HEPN domain
MNIETRKYKLINWIDNLEDESILDRLELIYQYTKNTKSKVTEKEKKAVEKGLKSIEKGEIYSHESIVEETKAKYPKLKFRNDKKH